MTTETDGRTPATPEETIDTADHVKHEPSGETWLVAFVRDGHVCPCGWPESRGELSDCTLVKKATPDERAVLLWEMCIGGGRRAEYARDRLRAECAAGLAAPAEPVARERPVVWMVHYDDYDRRPEIFTSEAAARHRFKEASISWNAHLFAKIESNSRDDKRANQNLELPAATPQAPSDAQMTVLAMANKVCGALPDGWEMQLCMERGAGWVTLMSPDGDYVPLPDAADKTLERQIDDALQAAIEEEAKTT